MIIEISYFVIRIWFMLQRFHEILEDNPIIAAVKDPKGLKIALQSKVGIIFILYGSICNLPDIVQSIKHSGRIAMVHVDLVEGLSNEEASLDYIKNVVHADGILTTKIHLIHYGNKIGLYTIHRYFVLDSIALRNIAKQSKSNNHPDAIEILPGVLQPKIIRYISKNSDVPVLCGGLVRDREDIAHALKNGATAVSTTRQEIWNM